MKDFSYLKAGTLEEALSYLEEFKGDAKVLAGGTDLVVRLKEDMVRENHILDISNIKKLKGIYMDEGFLHILPLTTHAEIAESREVKNLAPVLRQACLLIGSPQIRNRGTIGGNVGNASPAGDCITALYALEARVVVESTRGKRDIKVEQFFEGPKKTVLSQDEIITDIYMRPMEEDEKGFFKKLGQRDALAISVVNVSARIKYLPEHKKIQRAVIALGAVAPTVVRARRTEEALVGLKAEELENRADFQKSMMNICTMAGEEVEPISDVRAPLKYRKQMSVNLLYEGMMELFRDLGR